MALQCIINAATKATLGFLILALGVWPPGATLAEQGKPYGGTVKVPVRYVCKQCGAKIARESLKGKGFIAKCPQCGEPLLIL